MEKVLKELRAGYRLLQYIYFCFIKEFFSRKACFQQKRLVHLLKYIFPQEKESCRTDVAFDVYKTNSIKDVKRDRRLCGKLRFPQIMPEVPFSFSENKSKFENLYSQQ